MKKTEIAKALLVGRERIGQIEAKALRKLRHPSRKALIEKLEKGDFRKAILGE